MGVWSWLTRRRQLKSFSFTTGVMSGRSNWAGQDYTKLAAEGYKKNVIAFKCISLIARGVASLPWFTRKGDKEVDNHPLTDLLANPNPLQGGAAFFEALMSYYLIKGDSWVRAIGPDNGPPLELSTLRPDLMKVIPNETGIPIRYDYKIGTGTPKRFDVDVSKIEKSEVLHIKSFNPLDPLYGMSRLEAAAFSIDQHNAAGEWNYNLLKNGARPSGVLTYKPGGELMPARLSEEEYDRLKKEIKEKYSAPDNAGKPMLLDGGLEWSQTSLSPVDMDFLNSKNTSARDIAASYNIPPMLVGIVGDATFANYAEARLAAWEDEILPDAGMIRDELNRWLAPKFGDDISVDFNADGVPALAAKSMNTWEKIDRATFITINEKRAAAGYEDVDDGDVILIPAMMIPLGEDFDEGEGDADDVPPEKAAEWGYGR